MDIIPAIDLRDGRCVRLYQGEYDKETRYSDNPPAVAKEFAAAGLTRLHIVDLDGARDGAVEHGPLIQEMIDQSGLDAQLGGGLREEPDLEKWFDTGISRCVIGSMAIREAGTVRSWLDRFGADRIVLALDVRLDDNGVPMLATDGWLRQTQASLWDCIDGYLSSRIRHVLCTDIGRDGAGTGPNTALYREFIHRYPEINLQASGGVRDISDLEMLRQVRASAAITGRALHDGSIQYEELDQFLQNE